MQQNTDEKNSKYGHFLSSVYIDPLWSILLLTEYICIYIANIACECNDKNTWNILFLQTIYFWFLCMPLEQNLLHLLWPSVKVLCFQPSFPYRMLSIELLAKISEGLYLFALYVSFAFLDLYFKRMFSQLLHLKVDFFLIPLHLLHRRFLR